MDNVRKLRDIGVSRLLESLQSQVDDIEAITVVYQTKTDPPYTCWSIMKSETLAFLAKRLETDIERELFGG